MGKYLFNDIFKEIIETYYIDSTVLGNMTDRDPSRIRHYKTDSKPGKSVLEQLITSIIKVIKEANDPYVNSSLMDKLNQIVIQNSIFSAEIRNRLLQIKDITEYVPFLLRRSLEYSSDKTKGPAETPDLQLRGLITKAAQGHNLFLNNLYQDAIDLYTELLKNPLLTELPEQNVTIHTDLGLIYRTTGLNTYEPDTLKLGVRHLDIASEIALSQNDLFNNAVINKYSGTVYMALSNFEDAEANLKKAAAYYDMALRTLESDQEEYARVMINYGTLFIHYSNIRTTRNFLKNAIGYFEKSIDYYKDTNNYFKAIAYLNCSSAYSALAEVCNTQDNANSAIEMVQKALEIYTIEDYPLLYAQCISNLGHIYLTMAVYHNTVQNCNKAIGYIHHALSIFAENIDKYSYWIAHLNLTVIYILLSDATKDYSYLDKATECNENCKKNDIEHDSSINSIKSDLNRGDILISLAAAKKDASHLIEAEASIKSSLERSERMNYEFLTALAQYLLAKLNFTRYTITQDASCLNEVIDYTTKSLEVFTVNHYPLHNGQVTHLIAKVHRCQGEYEKSRLEYEGILHIFTKEKYNEKYKELKKEYEEICSEVLR